MYLVTFIYDKKTHEKPRRRIVGVKQEDSSYLHGYDLEDKQSKTFFQSNISNRYNFGDIVNLTNGVIAHTDDLFKSLGWGAYETAFFKSLRGTEAQLAEAVSLKTGQQVIPLGYNSFILLSKPQKHVLVGKLRMHITEGVIEYFDENNKKITLHDFTKKVLNHES